MALNTDEKKKLLKQGSFSTRFVNVLKASDLGSAIAMVYYWKGKTSKWPCQLSVFANCFRLTKKCIKIEYMKNKPTYKVNFFKTETFNSSERRSTKQI